MASQQYGNEVCKMRVIVEDKDDNIMFGFAQTFTYVGTECALWSPRLKSTFDMYIEMKPDILVVSASLYRQMGDELRAANAKFKTKIIVYGLELPHLKAESIYFCPKMSFANFIQNNGINQVDSYICDVALIANNLEQQDKEKIQQIMDVMAKSKRSFRVYGGTKVKIGSPFCVGSVTPHSYGYIYRHTKILLDLHGDHELNPELYGNQSVNVYDVPFAINYLSIIEEFQLSIDKEKLFKQLSNFTGTKKLLSPTEEFYDLHNQIDLKQREFANATGLSY